MLIDPVFRESGPDHERTFSCTLTIREKGTANCWDAQGNAANKQDAKHEAAKNMMQKLGPGFFGTVAAAPAVASDAAAQEFKPGVNYKGILLEFLIQHGITQVEFFASRVPGGEDHCPNFTCTAEVRFPKGAEVPTVATGDVATNKKESEQRAAHRLYQKISQLPSQA